MSWMCSHCGATFAQHRARCPQDGHRVIEDLTDQVIGGRYRIRELIGIGGMDSTVWKAWQTGTERIVAVKVLPAPDEAAAKRFSRGARIAANLNHPNCTTVHDYGRTPEGKLFLVMEFLRGRVLSDDLQQGPMQPLLALEATEQILRALTHAHNQRAVHRDLKPDNLYLIGKPTDPLHVKILDFGIAKYIDEDPEDPQSGEASGDGFDNLVTQQRQVCGTPQYMAPEQIVGGRVDGRTDIYSLGVVLFRMLTGVLPFDGKNRFDLYQKHLQALPPELSATAPAIDFPDGLDFIIQKALKKRPQDRFQTAEEMRRAVTAVFERLQEAASDPTSAETESPEFSDFQAFTPTIMPTPEILAAANLHQAVQPDALTTTPDTTHPDPPAPAIEAPQPPKAKRQAAPPPAPAPKAISGRASQRHSAPAYHVGRDTAGRTREGHPGNFGTSALQAATTHQQLLRKRRLGTAIFLASAFLLGVGGVALVMRVLPGDGQGTEPVALAEGTASEGQAPAELAVAPSGIQDPAQDNAPAQVEPSAEEAPPVGDTMTGKALGEAIAALGGEGVFDIGNPVARLTIITRPAGATILQDGEAVGESPLTLDLSLETHSYTVSLAGYVEQPLEVDLSQMKEGQTKVEEIRLRRAPGTRPQAGGLPATPTPARDEIPPRSQPQAAPPPAPKPELPPTPKPEPPKAQPPPSQPKPSQPKPSQPKVRLLDDEPSGGSKKESKTPSIRLLDD